MKSFLKYTLASVVGFFVATFLLIIFLVVVIASNGGKKEFFVKKNSVLHLKFDEIIPDRSGKNPFSGFDFSHFSPPMGLNEILENISKAAGDENVSGIFLDLSTLKTGFATTEEIRNALIDFKKSGKFIYAYSEVYPQQTYYLATVADKIFLHPGGLAELKGMRSELLFFKGTLDKLGLEPQVFRHGKFKSAVEPFIQDKLSNENREQIRTFIFSFWNHMLKGISTTRKIPVARLQEIADNLLVTNATEALQQHLVDSTLYRDEILEIIRKKTGAEAINKIPFVLLESYKDVDDKKEKGIDKIAVVYAEGDIVDGEGKEDEVGSVEFSKALRKARIDDKVKAVVLRINSPGGSALASETIWREVVLTKKVKPVIVSMGNMAASGGYYIACEADSIVAQPNTITGSIGVFGLFFNMKGLINKIGLSVDTVKTARHSDIFSSFRSVTPPESLVIQKEIEHIYDDFIKRVAKGRKLNPAAVDSIAQGRVWSGLDAKRIGLVDVMGGLETAIAIAAKKAQLKKYRIMELPFEENPIDKILADLSGDQEDEAMEKALGEAYPYYRHFITLRKMKHYQTRLPFQITLY